jgi:hypothetical protein
MGVKDGMCRDDAAGLDPSLSLSGPG